MPRIELAFSARIYFSDKRKSHSQIYVSDLYGKHRRQVTFGKEDNYGVRWSGSNTIVWVEWRDGVSKLMAASLPLLKPRLLLRYKSIIPAEDQIAGDRGRAIFQTENDYVEVTKGVLRRSKDNPSANADAYDSTATIRLSDGTIIRAVDPSALQPVTREQWSESHAFKRGGGLMTPNYRGFYLGMWPGRNKNETVLGTWEDGELHAEFENYYVLDWRRDTCKPLAMGLAGADITATDRYYAYLTRGGRDLIYWEPIKGAVWICGIAAGDLKTGKHWSVLGGWVDAGSVAVRPRAR